MSRGPGAKERRLHNKAVRIRERDGDDCWLCRQEIDFTLTGDDEVWGPSLDHVIPRENGGTWADENIRLAHRQCNASRRDLYPHTLPGGAEGRVAVKTWAR